MQRERSPKARCWCAQAPEVEYLNLRRGHWSTSATSFRWALSSYSYSLSNRDDESDFAIKCVSPDGTPEIRWRLRNFRAWHMATFEPSQKHVFGDSSFPLRNGIFPRFQVVTRRECSGLVAPHVPGVLAL